jgi:chemotaxis signal transduction protein
MREVLVVRAGERRVGLPIEHLVEVLELGDTRPVPSLEPALRGVTHVRGRMVPVLHLGALLAGAPCPAEASGTCVLTVVGGRRLCLEVDDAESVTRAETIAVPPEAALAWAAALVRLPEGMAPLLDLPAVAARLMETGIER